MMHTIGFVASSGTPTPVYPPLTQKLIDLGAIEVWPMDDASGGAAAINNANHNLLEEDGSNIAYEYQFECFPSVKGVDLTAGGDATYLRSGTDVADLRITDTDELTMVFVIHPDATFASQDVGCFVENDGTPDTNGLYGAMVNFSSTESWFFSQYGNNVDRRQGFSFGQNTLNTDVIAMVTYKPFTDTVSFYLNGELAGTVTNFTNAPTGGSDAVMIVGKSRRFTAGRRSAKYAALSVAKSIYTAADAVAIQASAMELATRFPSFTAVSTKTNTVAASGATNGQVYLLVNTSDITNTVYYFNTLAIGEKLVVAQWKTGKITLVDGSGHTVTGDVSTTNRGDCLLVEKTGATTYTSTLSSI